MLIDEVTIRVKAGAGGKGAVAFNKIKMALGPVGGSGGKGLGMKFLKHIERTKTLFHLIAAESEDLAKDYAIIRRELTNYNPTLAQKPEYLFLSKNDLLSPAEREKKITVLKQLNKNALVLSVYDSDNLDQVKKILNLIKTDK